MQVTPLLAVENVPRAEVMLGSPGDALAVALLRLKRVPVPSKASRPEHGRGLGRWCRAYQARRRRHQAARSGPARGASLLRPTVRIHHAPRLPRLRRSSSLSSPSSSFVTVPISQSQLSGFTYMFTSFNDESCLYCTPAPSLTSRTVMPS